MELTDEISADEYENTSEKYCSENSPEQYFMIVLFLNGKVFQDEQYDKNVINGKSIFGEVG